MIQGSEKFLENCNEREIELHFIRRINDLEEHTQSTNSSFDEHTISHVRSSQPSALIMASTMTNHITITYSEMILL